THSRRGTYNANDQAIARAFPALRGHNPLVGSARDGDIGYLAVKSWDNEHNMMDAIDGAMESLKDCRVLIVDVRANGGGDETQARRLAGWFLEEDALYAKHRFRDPDSDTGWTPTQ